LRVRSDIRAAGRFEHLHCRVAAPARQGGTRQDVPTVRRAPRGPPAARRRAARRRRAGDGRTIKTRLLPTERSVARAGEGGDRAVPCRAFGWGAAGAGAGHGGGRGSRERCGAAAGRARALRSGSRTRASADRPSPPSRTFRGSERRGGAARRRARRSRSAAVFGPAPFGRGVFGDRRDARVRPGERLWGRAPRVPPRLFPDRIIRPPRLSASRPEPAPCVLDMPASRTGPSRFRCGRRSGPPAPRASAMARLAGHRALEPRGGRSGTRLPLAERRGDDGTRGRGWG